ncbi:MAG: hypothetical protein KGZ61_02445 [Sandarakinorhabdus sp.]|nr:hypothetical protein [Sandarakinorhabdus sp.]
MAERSTITKRALAAASAGRAWLDSPDGTRAGKWFSYGISAIILLMLVRSTAGIGWQQVLSALPWSLMFWLLFTGSYLLLPLVDWITYRRWWGFGWPAIAVFLKVRVMNEALFTYSGHTYLLIWAAGRMEIDFDPDTPFRRLLGRGAGAGVDPRTSPFAAVKDMAITSGLAGNLATLLMLIVAFAMGGDEILGQTVDPATLNFIVLSFAVLIVLSVAILLFRRNVMSMPAKENMFAFRWHLFRVLAAHALIVGTWIVALPEIAISTWILLGALRMVIGRLPLPNKELLFAAIAVGLTGDASVEVAALMAAQGALHLLFHGIALVAAAAIEARHPEMLAGRKG